MATTNRDYNREKRSVEGAVPMQWWRGLSLGLVLVALAGCATTQTAAGSSALREGRPAEAAERFKEALAEDPNRVDAKIGLGISSYRLAAYDDAIATLTDAPKQAPAQPAVHLYLSLSHLRKRDDAKTIEELTALRALALEPRLAAQVDQTLALLRAGGVTDAIRTYVAASLDYAFDWTREVAETRLALRHAQLAWDPFWSRPYVLFPCRRC
jgi:tetratricopeptide (TPR) repeat protein